MGGHRPKDPGGSGERPLDRRGRPIAPPPPTVPAPGRPRIAFDARLLHRQLSGLERYMERLAPELSRIATFELDVLVREPYFTGTSDGPAVREVTLPDARALVGYLEGTPLDIYHLTWLHYRVSHYAALAYVPRTVLTVPDLIIYLQPGYLPRGTRLPYRLLLRRAVALAERLVVYSRFSRDELARHLRVPPERVEVIPLGVDDRFRPPRGDEARAVGERYGLPPGYVLALGKDYPHKNLETLLIAWARVLTRGAEDRPLVLAGQEVGDGGRVRRLVEARRLGDHVRFVGHVPDEDLPALYGGASCFVYPSRYEAFGLPLLEAMASGVPVVASAAGSLPEVVGAAGLLVDPDDPEALATALHRVLTDPGLRTRLLAEGTAQARGFTWGAAAARTAAVYEACRSGPRPRIPPGDTLAGRWLRIGARLESHLERLRRPAPPRRQLLEAR